MPDEIKTLNVRIPQPIWKAAKLESIETGESLNAMIVRLLAEYQAKTGQK